MKFAPMNYHYLRYPIKKFLDKVERSPFNSIDLYCSAPQLNLFDYPLLRLIELKKEIEAHHLSVMAMTPENCVCRSVPDSDTSISQEKRVGNTAENRCGHWRSIAKRKTSGYFWKS